ncbi:Transposase DDE domain-containing protein [Anaerovirgula multivorans]|uniref:Transposase DDE domain-containing protein n=1 Tax=Anaerovirgula multivorans TaxID=312168 RepID=A0A239GYM5_9FIRM|nr:Transposase DDE domain-containing protein [Anaerovirgula multivorans]
MKNYLEAEINKVENITNPQEHTKTHKVVENAKEILQDPKFIEQRGVGSIVDQDARVGHKSKTEHFFGYKNEYIITTDERFITDITVANGAYVDGTRFDELIELTKKAGLKLQEVYGDKAYFRKPILDKTKEIQAKAYIPVSEMAYKIDEAMYSKMRTIPRGGWFFREQALFQPDFVDTINSRHVETVALLTRV